MRDSIHVLGIIELDSVAQGYLVLDRMVKAAPVDLLRVDVINPGKFLIMVTGAVAEVEEAMKRGIAAAAECLLDYLFLPNLHPDVIPALKPGHDGGEATRSGSGTFVTGLAAGSTELDALGVIEAFTTTAGIEASDAAAKEADVRIVVIRVGDEMGGKSSATLTGPVGEVEASLDVARNLLTEKQLLVRTTVIPRPHEDLAPYLGGGVAAGRE